MTKEQFRQQLKTNMETIYRSSIDEVNGVTNFIVDAVYSRYKIMERKLNKEI